MYVRIKSEHIALTCFSFLISGDLKPPQSSSDAEIGSWSVRKRFGKLRIVDSAAPPVTEELPAPPRPPKPPHMLPENPGHNYLNLDGATESSKPTTPATPAPSTPATAIITDETYEFPKSSQGSVTEAGTSGRKCFYSNATPSAVDDRIFRYDFHEDVEPSSPRSESSATATYSNLPSPLLKDCSSLVPTTMAPPPPLVNRGLKPGRKMSDSTSVISNEPSPGLAGSVPDVNSTEHSPAEPPSINRKLKPPLNRPPVEGKVNETQLKHTVLVPFH